MSSMAIDLEEREVAEEASRRWWLFLLTGIAWLFFALLVFQWNYTTIYAVSYLFGVVAIMAAVNEFFAISVSTTGWKIAHGIFGAICLIAGIWALVHPHAAFQTLAALIGYFVLFKGILDITIAFMTRSVVSFWWLQLIVGILEIVLAFWVAGSFTRQTTLLVVYVGIIALARGITELILAFKLKGVKSEIGPPPAVA